MKRELKFRAWHKEDKEMLYPSAFRDSAHPKSEALARFPDEDCMQFTGLLDKNGVEIYEGDIVRRFLLAGDHPTHLGIVEWLWCSFQVKYKKGSHPLWQGEDTAGYFHIDLFRWAKDVSFGTEIIGNIYEYDLDGTRKT